MTHPALHLFLKPGVETMRRLRLPAKLVLVAAPLLVTSVLDGGEAGPPWAGIAFAVLLWAYPSTVIKMKLRQGCADEARALVERAVVLIGQEGFAAAAQRFHARDGGFIDRDLFIIVLDRRGHFRAFGIDPAKAGKPAVAAPGVDIAELNAKSFACADAGGGWIEFRSFHPVTKLPVDKMAYIQPAGAELVVMCGVNRSDGVPLAATPAAA